MAVTQLQTTHGN